MNWRQYQEQTADFFRSLGCQADVEARVPGARAEHKVDVWVRFRKFGLEANWVVECKYWNSRVTKEKVLVLRSVVEDVGADRGLLISVAGFQTGAVRASERTNITLTDLEGLKETAQEDLLSSVMHRIEVRATEIRYALRALYRTEQTGPYALTLTPRAGVDGKAVMSAFGKLAILAFGFECVRLKKPPYPVEFDEAGQRQVAVSTLEEFVARASDVIAGAEVTLEGQRTSELP